MNTPEQPEPVVSINAILVMILPVMGTIFFANGGVSFFDSGKGWMLQFNVLAIISGLVYLGLGQRPSLQSNRRRWMWTLTFCLIMVIGLASRQILIRTHQSRPEGIYDGAVQAEIAADFILHGKNPYGADYRGTSYMVLNKIPSSGVDIDNNPVWYHYIYPPLTFLIFTPFHILRPLIGQLADYRIISIGSILLITWLLLRRTKNWSMKTTITLLTIGNPLFWVFGVVGTNESLVSLMVVISILFFEKKRWLFAGAFFGAAIAAKQVVWVLVPLWLYWLWRRKRSGKLSTKEMRQVVFSAALVVCILFMPFILWSPIRAWTDMVVFASGGIPNTYPIAGSTLLQYLHVFRLIPSPWSQVPVYLFQLLVGIPMFILTARWLRHNDSSSSWLVASTVFLVSLMLVGRFFNNNFLTTPATFLALAYVLDHTGSGESAQE